MGGAGPPLPFSTPSQAHRLESHLDEMGALVHGKGSQGIRKGIFMSLDHLWQIVIEGATFELVKRVVGSIIVTFALTYVGAKVFRKLSKLREMIYFSLAMFVAIFTTLLLANPLSQGPNFAGAVQQVLTGGYNNDHDTIAIITMSIVNSGSMQSVAKNWTVETSVNGRKYIPSFLVPAPKNFTFTGLERGGPGSPSAMTFHGEDSILEKSMSPIQPGALVAGVLFVFFQNVDPSVFKGGADFTVNYEDVFSKTYAAPFKTTAKFDAVATFPGLHTDLACPVPPGGMPNFTTP